MLFVLPLILLLPIQSLSTDCLDRSPYCNLNDCSVRPGYAREFCKKTCGNCSETCENSKFVACTEDRKGECDAMLRDYCPILCGVCRPSKKKDTTTTETPVSTPLVIPPEIELESSLRRSPTKAPMVSTNRIEEPRVPIQPIYPAVTPVFLPELPQPEPIRPPYWAPQQTGYYPIGEVRRAPTRGFFPPSAVEQTYTSDQHLKTLVSLLGCRDRDPGTCSKITEEACLARPGFYLKLCPVRCRNCDGLQCFDSIKVDCEAVRHAGGCRLAAAAEYCPRSCQMCSLPPSLADSVSVCRDELETCSHLAEGGLCNSADGELLRLYCARSCGFCKQPQYYMQSPFLKSKKTS